ncbi:hypothetical protein N9R54_00405 [Pelobium sp.]|nr:DUF4175 family protein [Pelobium sp.]MDA9554669.1 hypothetical protein [Pelobium sp.]
MSSGYNQLIYKIDDFIRKYYLNKVVRGSIWLAALFIFSYLAIIISEYYGYFNPNFKTFLFYSFILTQFFLGWFLVIRHLFNYLKLGKIITHEQASEIIGNHFPEVKDKLINTLQLQKMVDENPAKKALIEASIDQRIAAFKPIPFVSAIKISENKKYLRYVLIPLSVMIIIGFAAPSIIKDGTQRFIHHDTFYKKKAPFDFIIKNKKLEAVQGDDFNLEVKLTGNQIPDNVYLEDGVNTFKLDKKDIITFSYLFKNVQKDKKFRLVAGEFFSEEFNLNVKNKPALLRFEVELLYPKYLNKKDEIIKNPEDLTIPAGTSIKWKFSTEYVGSIDFKLGNKLKKLTPIKENEFIDQERILKNSTYSLHLKNKDIESKDSISYKLNVLEDAYPKIEVSEKPDSVNARVIYFIGKASDDNGLSSLNFHFQILKSPDQNRKGKNYKIPVKLDQKGAQSSFLYLWQLKNIGVQFGEEIAYYFDIADNDAVYGPKHSKSATDIYKLASKEESLKNIEENTKAVQQKMESALRQAEKIRQETQKINQDLMDQKSIDYEQKKQIEQLLDKQKRLQELVKEIQQDSKQNLFDRKELQPEEKALLEKQKQIQDLFDNVLDEKTKQLLENLQKLINQNQKEQAQDQLQKMQADNKSLQKELDRILELYKKLEVEQKLNDAIDKLNDLSKDQNQLSKESLNKENSLKELQQKQQNLEKEFSDLKKDLKEVDDKNQQLERPEDFKNPEQEQKEIQQEMDNSEQQLEQNKSAKASQSQKNAAQKMQQLAQKLQQMQQNGQEEESKVNAQELRQLLQNLLKSSFDQEKLMTDLRKVDINDPRFVQLGQKQREIKDNLKMVEDSLYSLSKRVPQIESTVNKETQNINQQLTEALDQLSDRKITETNRNQQFALTSINNLALLLSDALQQLQNAMKNAQSGGKGKPQPGLSQLSEMQKELNKNMQKAREQMQQQGLQPGQKPSKQMSEQMAKMAQQQQMLRETLQQINNSLNKDGQGKLGDLEKIMKQMEQTETELVNKRITQEAILRQQEIQSRLLEAEKAEREREQDSQRESKAGKDFTPNYNLILQEYQKLKAKEVEQIKTVPPTLNYFYKSKISDYFKQLNSGN